MATGIAVRLMRANFRVVMLEIPQPTTVRRTVSFSEAVRLGSCNVEGLTARLCGSPSEALRVAGSEVAGVLVCSDGSAVTELRPNALVDSILAKRNTGTKINDAPVVVGATRTQTFAATGTTPTIRLPEPSGGSECARASLR